MRGGSAATRLSRGGTRSLDGSLIVRGLERAGAAITEPASEERESSWKVVGLMFRRDIFVRSTEWSSSLKVKLFAQKAFKIHKFRSDVGSLVNYIYLICNQINISICLKKISCKNISAISAIGTGKVLCKWPSETLEDRSMGN